MGTRPLTDEDWQTISPEFADLLQQDRKFLGVVDELLDVPDAQIDLYINKARFILQSMVDVPVTNLRLAEEIDSATWYILHERGKDKKYTTRTELLPKSA